MKRVAELIPAGLTAAAVLLLLPASPAAAKTPCQPKFVNPSPGETTLLAPTIKATADAKGSSCEPLIPRWGLKVIHADSGRTVYTHTEKAGPFTGLAWTPGMIIADKTVPSGELGKCEKYIAHLEYRLRGLHKIFSGNGRYATAEVKFNTECDRPQDGDQQGDGGQQAKWPDLTVSFSLEPVRFSCEEFYKAIEDLTLSATNRGNATASGTIGVALHISTDVFFDPSQDTQIASASVGQLSPGQTVQVSVGSSSAASAVLEPTRYELFAVIDPDDRITEETETNNKDKVGLDITQHCVPEELGERLDKSETTGTEPPKFPRDELELERSLPEGVPQLQQQGLQLQQ